MSPAPRSLSAPDSSSPDADDVAANGERRISTGALTTTESAAGPTMGRQEEAHTEGCLEDDSLCDLFTCHICGDVHIDPCILPCCGKAFCCNCLRQWIQSNVRSSGYPRCPQGCKERLKYRLPKPSHCLQATMEGVIPNKLADRLREAQEDAEADGDDICHGGFRPWQDVAAATEISFEDKVGVKQGTPGIVIGDMGDGIHLTVKFDRREDNSELCVNVAPQALMEPLPGNFRLGQRIVAADDCILGGTEVGVALGTGGVVVAGYSAEHLSVLFDRRLDGLQGPVIISTAQLHPERRLVGGFLIGQRIQAVADLTVGIGVVAKPGAVGTVHCEFSETRLTVNMDGENSEGCRLRLNVLPTEISLWCELPVDFPPGHEVETTMELMNRCVSMKPGTRGIVVSGINRAQILVNFEALGGGEFGEDSDAPCYMTVDLGAIKSCETGNPSEVALRCKEGHVLNPFVSNRCGFQCDSCETTMACGISMLGCRSCDYDLCIECVQAM